MFTKIRFFYQTILIFLCFITNNFMFKKMKLLKHFSRFRVVILDKILIGLIRFVIMG